METVNSSSSHNLIPEKSPTFEPKNHVFFSKYLAQFEDIFEESFHDFSEWEDETLLLMLKQKDVTLSALDQQKLLAFNNFNWLNIKFATPLEFRNMALILNGDIAITDSLEPIDPAYIAWAIELLEDQDSNNEIEITDDVATYIALCFYEDGFLHMPKDLSIFNEYLDVMVHRSSEVGILDANEKIERVNTYLFAKRKELKAARSES